MQARRTLIRPLPSVTVMVSPSPTDRTEAALESGVNIISNNGSNRHTFFGQAMVLTILTPINLGSIIVYSCQQIPALAAKKTLLWTLS